MHTEKELAKKGPSLVMLHSIPMFAGVPDTQLEQIAKVARPQSFQNGRLFVGTNHPTWVTELSYRREEIREKLNRAVGYNAVQDVVFRLARK